MSNFISPNSSNSDSSFFPAEAQLLWSLENETDCIFQKDNKVECKIRGSFLRSLILGKLLEHTIPPRGLVIHNAYIVGDIDLRGCNIEHLLEIYNSQIIGVLNFSHSKIQSLILRGTSVEELILSEIEASGNIILSKGFKTLNPVIARGAKIKGQLGCSEGGFHGHPIAISLEAAIIEEAFFWRGIVDLWGFVDLTSATIGTLIDDSNSWPQKGELMLAGCTYEKLGSNTDYDYYNRLEWLQRQYLPHLNEDFRPQPFEQLIGVLKKSGREKEARCIAIQKLHFQRNADFQRRNLKVLQLQKQLSKTKNIFVKIILERQINSEKKVSFKKLLIFFKAFYSWLLSYIFWAVAGYGYRPMRCIIWIIVCIGIGSIVFGQQHDIGNLVTLDSPVNSIGDTSSAFHPIAFAADVFLPIIDLKQSTHWVLREDLAKPYQAHLIFYWIYILVGWALTAIFAASVTGLVRK